MSAQPALLPVILSGGSGTRLWPASRELHPKQFLPLLGCDTLLQGTVLRLNGLGDHLGTVAKPLLVCNEEHRFLVAEQLRSLGCEPSAILLEPVARNTAPAITLAALTAETWAPDPVMLVMPADHAMLDVPAFQRAVAEAYALAAEDHLVTFGIEPNRPETGFGYIQRGAPMAKSAARVARFVEKPDRSTAERYLAHGDYLWNSGIFMMRASTWLKALAAFRPDILSACESAVAQLQADRDFLRVGEAAFRDCPAESIDYAVMEKVASDATIPSAVIPLDAGWSDVGAWPAVWEMLEKDGGGNVCRGDVLLHDSRGSMVLAGSRLVAAVGVSDLLVVETADAVLVADKAAAQDVKLIAGTLKQAARREHAVHRRVHRPWGSFEGVDAGERYQVKRLTVAPGASLSLQLHRHRAEHWVVVKGRALVVSDGKTFELGENESTYVPPGVAHRLTNPGTTPLQIIEVQSGDYLGEDDIVRLEDNYGRE